MDIIAFITIYLICKNPELPLYYNPFGLIYLIIYSPIGIFVTAFCFRHTNNICKGYTTKQIHSIKTFFNEIQAKNFDKKTLNVYKEMLEDNKENKYIEDVYENNSCGNKLKNLCKFYCKKTPKSLIDQDYY